MAYGIASTRGEQPLATPEGDTRCTSSTRTGLDCCLLPATGSGYQDNTIAVVGLPAGQHKIMVEFVDAQHHAFTACAECKQTITFTVPGTESALKSVTKE